MLYASRLLASACCSLEPSSTFGTLHPKSISLRFVCASNLSTKPKDIAHTACVLPPSPLSISLLLDASSDCYEHKGSFSRICGSNKLSAAARTEMTTIRYHSSSEVTTRSYITGLFTVSLWQIELFPANNERRIA